MNPSYADQRPPTLSLVGCGILHKEVEYLIQQHQWPISTHFLQSALHNYLGQLRLQLDQALSAEEQQGHATLVFYGSCHPLMDSVLQQHGTCRVAGQNCIVMLLGYADFMNELSQGAYFLLEDWALTWEPMITAAFGSNLRIIRDIFHSSHRYILALHTPCSGDFTQAAEAAAAFIDLPLRWREVSLEQLDATLSAAVRERLGTL